LAWRRQDSTIHSDRISKDFGGYLKSLKTFPNPKGVNLTQFGK